MLRSIVGSVLLFALLAPPAHAKTAESVKQVAMQFFTDLIGGNKAACEKVMLTHTELTALSTRRVDKKEYEAEVQQFLTRRIAEFTEGKKRLGDMELARVRIVDVKILTPDSSKLKQTAVHVAVVPMIKIKKSRKPERGGMPFFFVQQGVQWKFMWKM